jgi:toxin ParE1/3/4
MTPIWSPEAIADLAALRAYIAQDDPAAAQRVALHIIRNVETLLPKRPEGDGRVEFRVHASW